MLTKTQFTDFIDGQRYLIVSLVGAIEAGHEDLIKENIELLWNSTQTISDAYNLKVKSLDYIVQHGRDMVELEKMYNGTDTPESVSCS